MIPQSGVSASAPVRAAERGGADASPVRLPIDIRRFPWIRRLAVDYAFDYARVAEFFAGNAKDLVPKANDNWPKVQAKLDADPYH